MLEMGKFVNASKRNNIQKEKVQLWASRFSDFSCNFVQPLDQVFFFSFSLLLSLPCWFFSLIIISLNSSFDNLPSPSLSLRSNTADTFWTHKKHLFLLFDHSEALFLFSICDFAKPALLWACLLCLAFPALLWTRRCFWKTKSIFSAKINPIIFVNTNK